MSRIDKAIEMAAGIQAAEKTGLEKNVTKPMSATAGKIPRATVDRSNNLLVAVNNPHGEVAEEYNKLRALIEHLVSNEERKNTILITSAVSGEGKTLTAANLALTMARTGEHTVFLIDCDLRRPTIAKLLNIKNEKGLVHCLRDNLPFERALTKAGQGKLAVLTAGQKVEDPLELLSSNHMQQFIEGIKNRYPSCYCIIDSPPVLPFADARVMGALVDSTIFVTRENYTRLSQLKEGIGYLHGCDVLGVLCNDSTRTNENKYGSYY